MQLPLPAAAPTIRSRLGGILQGAAAAERGEGAEEAGAGVGEDAPCVRPRRVWGRPILPSVCERQPVRAWSGRAGPRQDTDGGEATAYALSEDTRGSRFRSRRAPSRGSR